jgi:hypothetical protein
MSKEVKQALQISIDYMNERLEDHDCKYQRHPATEAERINILADIETVKEALAKQEGQSNFCPQCEALARELKAAKQEQGEPVCHICKGTGEMDSGGTYPWGWAINIPCECTAPQPKQEQNEPVANDILKWKLRGYTTLDPLQNERIAESFGWGKGESYDDCICCSAFNLHDFSEAIRFDERERLVGKTKEPAPDKSSLFTHKTLISYAASCVADALSNSVPTKQEQGEIERLTAALKKANEQAEHFEREWYLRGDELEKLKQEQGEPVAWRIRCTDPLRDWVLMYRYPNAEQQFSNMEIQPLYTTPQQRKPLTDEQIEHLIFKSGGHKSTQNLMSNPMQTREYVELWNERIYAFAREIEAAHGIKEKNT